ncbi:carboxylesterase family protein [Fibrella aquatilis]|uniref:Prolyl oligopeptidase family serine peptidase n=1 Tax=Fibrella aquatilis TaxID=2817059 RepID=A0A939G797_9BACT|nr:prolyl oligopeptidase family serine peptidase [Fibrella aquatilis]MBO0931680.1 prolyl oligopeptidase family serine peptidase [Fibrella aquatilis]
MRFVLLFALVLFSFSVLAQTKKSASYPYQLYLPKNYAVAKRNFPLVIYLHGGSQKGTDLAKLSLYGPPKQVSQGHDFPFVMAAPQCPEGKFWSTDNWFDSLFTELTTRYRIDKKRVYLTGISMGGYGTWQTAVAHPHTFAAIMPLCGGCDDSTQICSIRNIPVWTFHGTADDLIPIDETARLVKRLERCHGKVQFTKLPNEGHGIQYLYENPKLYQWLLQQHK